MTKFKIHQDTKIQKESERFCPKFKNLSPQHSQLNVYSVFLLNEGIYFAYVPFLQISNCWSVVALEVVAKMGANAPLLVFPTWGAQPLASEDAAQRRAGR